MALVNAYSDIKKIKKKDHSLRKLDISVWIRAFSRSLIAVFIPILLLDIGYTLNEVILYYFLLNLIDVPLNFLSRKLIRQYGAKIIIIVGSLLSVIFFIFFYNLPPNNIPLLILLAVLAAGYDALYWVGTTYLFMVSSKNDSNVSEDLSGLMIARKLGSVFAPLFGALLLIFFTKDILIIASTLILLISFIPLLAINPALNKPKIPKGNKKFFKDFDMLKDYISTGLFSIHRSAEMVLWPLFIYITFTEISAVATMRILIAVSSIIFMYFVGTVAHKQRTMLVIVGSVLTALIWMFRLAIDNSIFYYVSTAIIGFLIILVTIPLGSNLYEKGEKIDALSVATYENSFSMGSRALLYGIILILLNVFNTGFITAIASLSILVLINFTSVSFVKDKSTKRA